MRKKRERVWFYAKNLHEEMQRGTGVGVVYCVCSEPAKHRPRYPLRVPAVN